MSKFCDRSPCEGLLKLLGRYLFGNPETGGFVLLVRTTDDKDELLEIEYCPHCGYRLEKLCFSRGETVLLS